MATAQQIASAGAYATDDVGLEVTDGTSSRAQLGKLPGGTYGLRVVSSDGSTVIIDGTSDMFKIAASGTLTAAFPAAGSAAQRTASLPGLGVFSTLPVLVAMTSYDATSGFSGRLLSQDLWVTFASGAVQYRAFAVASPDTQLPCTMHVLFQAESDTVNPGTTGGCKWFVLQEAGL